jgi:hypothetical protein
VASDIIPIELSLTHGNGVTLWAPRWVEDGEEWEAFLGHGDDLYLLPDAAHLAAFIRSTDEHDLADHPQWDTARRLLADELVPDDDHRFDIVGVPDLVAEAPDVWTLAELSDTVAILHSLAEVCGLDVIDEVLGSAPGFAMAAAGPTAFIGRAGSRLWDELGSVVAARWDSVIESLDAIVATPDVDPAELRAAQAELDAVASAQATPEVEEYLDEHADAEADGEFEGTLESDGTGGDATADRDPDLAFWDEVGIDCLNIAVAGRSGWTMRCYLDDAPVFLSVAGRIQMFSSPAKLERYLADPSAENALAHLDAWNTIRDAVSGGEASVIAGPENTYQLDGLDQQLLTGPENTDAGQLALAVELLGDAAAARGDSEVADALSSASPLGNLVRAITRPDPDRLPPSPPFDDEVAAWRTMVDSFGTTLDWR